MTIQPRLSIITLGVADLDRARSFYTDGLGWPLGAMSNDNIAFFEIAGISLALFQKDALAEDAGIDMPTTVTPPITLAYMTRSEGEVHDVMKLAVSAGGREVSEPVKRSWGGYTGYISDPDGFLWEVAYNPYVILDEDGRMTIKDDD